MRIRIQDRYTVVSKSLTKRSSLSDQNDLSYDYCLSLPTSLLYTDKKKKQKSSSYLRKSRRERLQSHTGLTATSYMTKYLRISSYIRKHFLIYDFATAPLYISLYMRKILLSFLSVYCKVGTIIQIKHRQVWRIRDKPNNTQGGCAVALNYKRSGGSSQYTWQSLHTGSQAILHYELLRSMRYFTLL